MNTSLKFYGAKAIVYLKYEDQINELAKKMSEILYLPNFSFDSEEDAPHSIVASCEALGSQIWIEPSSLIKGFSFVIRIETEDSFNEIFHNQMYDLSLWLARFISKLGEIDSCIIDVNQNNTILFSQGEVIDGSVSGNGFGNGLN